MIKQLVFIILMSLVSVQYPVFLMLVNVEGETRERPKQRSKRLNVLDFLSRDGRSFFHTIEPSAKSEDVIYTFDAFSEQYYKEYQQTRVPCIIVLDNASIHHSRVFTEKISRWESKAVFLHFLPAYSPMSLT